MILFLFNTMQYFSRVKTASIGNTMSIKLSKTFHNLKIGIHIAKFGHTKKNRQLLFKGLSVEQ